LTALDGATKVSATFLERNERLKIASRVAPIICALAAFAAAGSNVISAKDRPGDESHEAAAAAEEMAQRATAPGIVAPGAYSARWRRSPRCRFRDQRGTK
jgi:hypothetical protein